jgi:hypothetical protein
MEGNMTYLQRREVVSGLAGLTIGQALLGRVRLAFAADKIKPNVLAILFTFGRNFETVENDPMLRPS